MLKWLVTSSCLALTLAACATHPVVPANATADAKPPPGCVAQTGTMFKARPTDCNGFGNTYTQADLRRTGQLDVADALRRLDPAITPR